METKYEVVQPSDDVLLNSAEVESHLRSPDVVIKSSYNRSGSETPNENSSLLHSRMKIQLTVVRQAFSNRNFFVDLLTVAFGIGTWIGINSTFVQLPLLVLTAPEGWSLASYVVIIIQVANIGPILYTVIQKIRAIRDAYIIYALLSIGVLAAISMALFYNVTSFIFNAERSFALLAVVFCFALVGCTSSVLFMPWMGRFREVYLITYLIGEGLSGFLPSVVALIQGVGGNSKCVPNNSTDPNAPATISYSPPPRFGTDTFFYVIFALFVSSLISFLLLDKLPTCKKEHADVQVSHGNKYVYKKPDVEISAEDAATIPVQKDNEPKAGDQELILSPNSYKLFLILLGIVCTFANGIFPSIMVYSTNPYGNVVYHITASLYSIANPIACFIAVFLPHRSMRNILLLTLFSAPLVVYAITTSAMSPTPPLVGQVIGEVLIVFIWTILGGLFSYIRLSITTIFRYQGGKALVWVGVWTQIGSFVGAVISFILVNITNSFTPYQPCK